MKLEKKKEFELVQALEKASTNFLSRIEGLGEDFDVMADAGTGEYVKVSFGARHDRRTTIYLVCGQVLEQWPQMFRILGLICKYMPNLCESDRKTTHVSSIIQRTVLRHK